MALGTAVIPSFIVPLMGGTDGDKVRVVQTLLFVEGVNTLLQTLFGTRFPTGIGWSYAFMVPIISIIHDSSLPIDGFLPLLQIYDMGVQKLNQFAHGFDMTKIEEALKQSMRHSSGWNGTC